MNRFVVGVVALLVGLVVGQWLPSGQIKQLEEEVAALREQGGETRSASQEVANQLARSLVRTSAPCPPEESEERPARAAAPEQDEELAAVRRADDDDSAEPFSFEGWEGNPEDLPQGEELDVIIEAARFRTEQFRDVAIDEGGLSDEEVEAFDGHIAEMNDALTDQAEDLLDVLSQGDEPNSLDMLTLVRDMADTLVVGAEGMRDVVGDASEDLSGDTLDPFNYIDPSPFLDFLSELDPPAESGQ